MPCLQAKEVASEALKRLLEFNWPTLDGLATRLSSYFLWAHECTGTPSKIRRWVHGAPPLLTLDRLIPVGLRSAYLKPWYPCC